MTHMLCVLCCCPQVPFNPRLRETPKLDIVAPLKGEATFVAPNAKVIGNVTLGKQVSVWYGAVLRGEQAEHTREGLVAGPAVCAPVPRPVPLFAEQQTCWDQNRWRDML